MLCGILEPSDGTAKIGGHDIVREMEPIKEMIGYMSQQFSLYDELTVNENLIFSANFTVCVIKIETTSRRNDRDDASPAVHRQACVAAFRWLAPASGHGVLAHAQANGTFSR
jgi:ABC-type multidrug transport system, ATPase component